MQAWRVAATYGLLGEFALTPPEGAEALAAEVRGAPARLCRIYHGCVKACVKLLTNLQRTAHLQTCPS